MNFISLLTKNLYSSKPWYLCLLKEVHSPIFFQLSVFSNFILLLAINLRNISYQNCSPRKKKEVQFSSFQSLSRVRLFATHESQHARTPCPSPAPGVHSNSRPLSQWCHPAISSSVVPFSSCPQSLPASESFLVSQLFTWGGQSTGVSALASFLPEKSQHWSPSEWTGWISLQSKGLSRVFSNTTVQSINSLALSFLHSPTLTSVHDHWKNHSLD